MMPHHRNMHRAQCHVRVTCGGLVASHVLTLRFTPGQDVSAAAIQLAWANLASSITGSGGIAGLHVLRHETPNLGLTTEQKIRGSDQTPDWIAVASAFQAEALDSFQMKLEEVSVRDQLGLPDVCQSGRYMLSYSALAKDVSDVRPRGLGH